MWIMNGSRRQAFLAPVAVVALGAALVVAPTAQVTPASATDVPRPAVVQLVGDIRQGPAGSGSYGFTTFGDHAYFTANDGEAGFELWRTDGIDAELFADLNPGSDSGGYPDVANMGPGGFTVVDDVLYFAGHDGVHGNELFRTDGDPGRSLGEDPQAPELVADIDPGGFSSSPGGGTSGIAVLDGELYFGATQTWPDRRLFEQPMTWTEQELWRTSGSGVVRYEVNPYYVGGSEADPESGNPDGSNPGGLTTFKGYVYFAANGTLNIASGQGRELWRANSAGASLVADLNPGYRHSSPSGLTVAGDHLYFYANGADGQQGLWRTAGGAPEFVAEFAGVPATFAFDGELYFAGRVSDGTGNRETLWRTDGSTVRELDEELTSPRSFTRFGEHVYFVAGHAAHGRELWRTDGDAVELVADIQEGTAHGFGTGTSANSNELIELEGFLYFAADDGVHGRELWRTDGTTTDLVRDLRPGVTGSFPTGFARVGRNVVFAANDGELGPEVWRAGVPGPGIEGPPGHASCSDGVDNDEDGLVDLADPDCQGPTEPEGTAPAAPTAVSAVRGDGRATVSWRPGEGSAATRFTVTAAPGGRSATVGAGARSAVLAGLRNGTAYRFTVAASNAHGTSAPSSASAAVTPAGVPARVTGVKAKAKKLKKRKKRGRVVIRWKKAGANGAALSGYRVVLRAKGAKAKARTRSAGPRKTKLVWKKLEPGRYRITVAAANGVGTGRTSKVAKVRVVRRK